MKSREKRRTERRSPEVVAIKPRLASELARYAKEW
jgi:hypothetical protein